jgi:hypothetical protein
MISYNCLYMMYITVGNRPEKNPFFRNCAKSHNKCAISHTSGNGVFG